MLNYVYFLLWGQSFLFSGRCPFFLRQVEVKVKVEIYDLLLTVSLLLYLSLSLSLFS